MPRHKTVYVVSCGIAAAALAGGVFLVLAYGFSPPPWLLTAELAILSALALACGFTARLPALLPRLRLRPVRGAMLICLGVAAVYLPPQFIASAVFLSLGVKLVWAEACDLAAAEKRPETIGTAIVRHGGNGTLVAADATPGPELTAMGTPDRLPPPGGRKAVARRQA
jgi:hypothetical protein